MDRIFVEAYCSHLRNEIIHKIQKVISENGGWIVDHQMFSDKSITLLIETDNLKLEKMFHDFQMIEVNMNSNRLNTILLGFPQDQNPGKINLYMVINFMENHSSRQIKVPAVPG